MKNASKRYLFLCLTGTALVGCQPPPVPPKPMAMPAPAAQTRAQMTQSLIEQDAQFGPELDRLPGISTQDHRQVMAMLLQRLSNILQLANGPVESPSFQNRVAVIAAAGQTVSDPQIPRRRMEAEENQALSSTAPALQDITTRYLYDDQALPPLLQNLNNAISAASVSVGPMHDLDATSAFMAVRGVIDRMTTDLGQRFLSDSGPMVPESVPMPPAGQPNSSPATTQADATTMPATAPTTSP